MEEIYCTVWAKDGSEALTEEQWYDYDDSNLHRLDGPAIEYKDGTKEWCVDGKCHRLDGPAVEYKNGTKEWWVNGKYLDTKEVETWLKENNVDLSTEEGQAAFNVYWSFKIIYMV
jgi:hypothetical protein